MEKTPSPDFLCLDDFLTEDEKLIRHTVREWVAARVQPIILDHFSSDQCPTHLIPEMAELGFFAPWLPAKYGGDEFGRVAYGLVCQELEKGDSSIRTIASVHSSLAMYAILAHGSEEQRRKFLPEMKKGKIMGCFGLTEPGAGSDPGALASHAVKDGNEYVLNGQKSWISSGGFSDLSIIWAKLDGVIRGFLVERGTPGFSVQIIKNKFAMRASDTADLFLEDVHVPAANLLPLNPGLKGPLQCLTQARYGIAWGVIGAAMDCYERTVNYTLERHQFGRPLAANQLVQADLVWMITEISKAQLLNWRLGKLKDEGRATPAQVSMGKMNGCKVALEVSRKARDLLGAAGISYEYGIARHLSNLEAVYTYEGTHNVHTLAIGREITGLDALKGPGGGKAAP